MPNVTLHFFAANDLNGSPIFTIDDDDPAFKSIAIRAAIGELGGGEVTLSRDVGEAFAGSFPEAETFIRVIVHAISDTRYVWGWFLTGREHIVLSEEEEAGEDITLSGPGPLFYLDRAILWDEQFLIGSPSGEPYRIDLDNGVFRFEGDADIGNVLSRLVGEDNENTIATFLPDLTDTITPTLDSAGNAWAADTVVGSSAEPFELPIGQSFLADVWAALDATDATVDVTMDLGSVGAPTMELNAWQAYGEDRTGTAFGSGVVLWKSGVNIETGIDAQGRSRRIASHVLVRGNDGTYARAVRTAWDPGEYAKAVMIDRPNLSREAALERSGLRWLRRQDNGEREIELEITPGHDEDEGYYFPDPDGGAAGFWLGYLISLKTGPEVDPSPLDYDYSTERVTGIRLILDKASKSDTPEEEALSWHVVVELNVERGGESSPANGSGSGGVGCRCLRLCDEAIDVVLDLADASLKSSGEHANPWPREFANDGDLSTHWSEPDSTAPPEGYWAADIGQAKAIQAYRLVQGVYDVGAYTGIPKASTTATEVRIYGSNDDAAWSWLPTNAKLSADPAANGWTLLRTDTSGAGPAPAGDTGLVFLDSSGSYRYVLLRAVSGGSVADGWDVGTFEVWSNPHAGTSNRASRCDHTHPAEDITYSPVVSGLDAWDVQAALDELAAGVNTYWLDPAITHRLLLVAHRGDINPTDGYPEDTLEAAIQAWNRGCPIVEVDAQLTSDSVFVGMHDATVNRTTNGTGNVSGMTVAAFVALTIDGGFGYNAGRHGSTLSPTTIQAFIEAAIQHGGILEIENKPDTTASFAALAELVVSLGGERNVRINCYDNADVATVKGVSQAITTMGVATDADYVADNTAATIADVTAYAPKAVAQGMGIGDYGNDETTELTLAWNIGVRSFGTNDLPAAINILHGLMGVGGATDHGALTGLDDDDHTNLLNETRHDALDHAGLAGIGGGLLTVDPGTVTYNHAGDDVIVSVAAVWGYGSDGPYYDDAGVTSGEEAILAMDPETGETTLVPYNS